MGGRWSAGQMGGRWSAGQVVGGGGQEEAQRGSMKAVQGQGPGQEEGWRDWVPVGEGEEQEDEIKEKVVVEGGEPEGRFQLASEALLESSPLALCSVQAGPN